jgi:hypothetical protein
MTRQGKTQQFTRRAFVAGVTGLAAGSPSSGGPGASQEQARPAAGPNENRAFFTIDRRHGRWWFVTPEDEPSFSVGVNHIDSATLRYPENVHIWRDAFGGSMERWLKEAVGPDLRRWGFNTVGWVQEVVTRTLTNHRHSRNFTFEEYQWLGLPYCHMLPFADFHQWEVETRHPDLFSDDFEQWCDYVARAECSRFADDPKLIGYFYLDCPTWVHDRRGNEWKGPMFDPDRLETDAGRMELFALAQRYYRVTHDAVRRYDRNHLILGDRYEGRAPLPDEVVRAASPYVDVLSFQHFSPPEQIRDDFERWHALAGKPILLADAARHVPAGNGRRTHDVQWYRRTMETLREVEACVGFHLCGAYLRNRVRRNGLRDEDNREEGIVEAISEVNRDVLRGVRGASTRGEPS